MFLSQDPLSSEIVSKGFFLSRLLSQSTLLMTDIRMRLVLLMVKVKVHYDYPHSIFSRIYMIVLLTLGQMGCNAISIQSKMSRMCEIS